MKKNQILAGIAILIVVLAIGVLYQANSKNPVVVVPNNQVVAPKVSPAELKANYEKAVYSIIGNYLRLQDGGAKQGEDSSLSVSATQAKDSLLSLTVPVEYKDLHLSLVIAFTDLADTKKAAIGDANLTSLIKKYSWLQPSF